MEPTDLSPSATGSIADVSRRLALWARRAPQGFARVEYSSEFSRQRVVTELRRHLAPHQLTVQEITLPPQQDPAAVVANLLAALQDCDAAVMSVTGFATAFNPRVSLAEALQGLNFNRERLHRENLRQIWWMTPVFLQTAIHAMPDLNSWFSLRLSLTETLPPPTEAGGIQISLDTPQSTANIDDARQRADALLARFATAQATGTTDQELLTTYLLPALEALAEVGAQKELRDLTSQFEGWLAPLKRTDAVTLASVLDRLARLYDAQGRYGEAEPLFRQVLDIRRSQLGPDHPATATSLNNLAELYRAQGRYGEAEPLYLQALKILRSQLSDDHPATATSLNNLAELYRDQGRYGEVEPLYLQSLEILRSQLGPDHADTAASLNNLAGLYLAQGRYREAEPLYLQALDITRSQLGPDHPATATSLNNLASLYRAQGRYGKAESLYLQALEIRRSQLGPDHPATATSLNNLAGLYHAQGRYGEAEPLYRQALKIRRSQLRADHPATATSLNNLAELYRDRGRYGEAEPLYLQALEIRRSQFGPDHPTTATSLNNLALLYQAQGRYGEAESFLQQALEIMRSQFGEYHPDTATSLNNLATFYESQKCYEKAEPLYLKSLEILTAVKLDLSHPKLQAGRENLAKLYDTMAAQSRQQGHYGKVVEYLEKAIALRQIFLSANS